MDEEETEMGAAGGVPSKKGTAAKLLIHYRCAPWTLCVGTDSSSREAARAAMMATWSMAMGAVQGASKKTGSRARTLRAQDPYAFPTLAGTGSSSSAGEKSAMMETRTMETGATAIALLSRDSSVLGTSARPSVGTGSSTCYRESSAMMETMMTATGAVASAESKLASNAFSIVLGRLPALPSVGTEEEKTTRSAMTATRLQRTAARDAEWIQGLFASRTPIRNQLAWCPVAMESTSQTKGRHATTATRLLVMGAAVPALWRTASAARTPLGSDLDVLLLELWCAWIRISPWQGACRSS